MLANKTTQRIIKYYKIRVRKNIKKNIFGVI